MSRTATGAVLVFCLAGLLAGPELGFGPTTATSRADERRRSTPVAAIVVIRPDFVALPAPPPPPPPRPVPVTRASRRGGRAAAAVPGGDVWARLRACESPSGGGGHYRGYYQFSTASWHAAGGSGDPAAASIGEQTARAQYLAAHSNPAQQWPVCWHRATA
jgi:hypothetical protein